MSSQRITDALPDAMQCTVTVRNSKRPANHSDRAQARLIRQKIMEQEQEIEDREACKITLEELQILHDSFASVKAEFSDLDGLSWETPSARQVLINWYAQQDARQHSTFFRASPGGFRMRRPHSRRSLSSLISPIPTSPQLIPSPLHSNSNLPNELARDTEDVGVFIEDTIRTTPSPSASEVDRDMDRTPLPRLFCIPDDILTPSASCKQLEGDDGAPEPPTPVPVRQTMPKSRSSQCFATDDSLHLPTRPTKGLPASRIPISRSQSLSAKPTSTLPTSASAPELSLTARTVERLATRAHIPSSREHRSSAMVGTKMTRTGRNVLTNLSTLNQAPTSPPGLHSRLETGRSASVASPRKVPSQQRADKLRGTIRMTSLPPALSRTRATEGRVNPNSSRPAPRTASVEAADGNLLLPMSRTATVVPELPAPRAEERC